MEFEVERQRGNSLAPLPVRVRTWEPNQRADDGSNPTDQIHTVILPAVAMTSHWTNYYGNVGASQSVKFSVTVTSDTNYESLDYLNAVVLPSEEGLHDSRSRTRYRIHDLDLPTIALSVDPTSITEGEALTFTLTRGNNTTENLIVGVSVNDPGGFLEGNFGTDGVATPAFVVFAPDDLTATVTLTPPDDWRDIPDSTLTFTVVEDSAYEITGSASLTVQVADNDVAPQVGISFNQAEVEEGNDLILTITRTGEDKNPLQVPITAGPVGDEEDFVVELDAGESQAQVTFSRFDDNSKGPDTDYAATLQPGSPEFWTSTGPGTVTATILDDDLYKVGIEMLTPVVSEGQYIRYRIFHDGHSGESLDFKVRRSEDGSAVLDTVLGDFTWQFSAGTSEQRISTLSEAHDGSDGDAVFTIEILPGDGYTVDPAYASGQAIVRDSDPLPVLGLRNLTVRGNESDGTFEFRVDMVSPLPSLRTVTVDYEVRDSVTSDGIDITESTGTLTFAAGETSAVIEVPILQDLIAEEDEEFVVVLTNPVYATFQDGQSSLTARGVIEDDEPTVTVAATEIAISEGEDVEVTLTRTGAATGELTAWLMVRLTGGPGGTTFPQVTFSAGSSTVTYTINTEDDDEALGSFEVKISVAHPADDVGQANTYRTTGAEETVIVGDDEQPGVWLETMNDDGSAGNGNPYPLIPIPRRIYEGQAIFFKLIRLRSGPSLTINLQGTGAENFVSGTLPTTATIRKGSKTATIRIETANDLVAESHAEFTLTILEGAGYAPGDRVGRRFSAGHWIYDNDTYGLPKLRITENRAWVNEGEDVVFTLQRIGDTQASLDVNVRVLKNGGDADTNFIQEVGDEVVTFVAGADTTTLTIATVDDNLNHGDRNIVAAIAPGAYFIDESVPNVDEEMVWIQDDDRPTVTLTPATDEFEEGTPQMVTLNRVGDNSPYLSIPTMIETTVHHPNSADERTTLYEFPFTRINKGLASFASRIGTTQQVEALGASGRIWFLPRTCIDSPEYPALGGCGDSPQYLRGSQYEQTFIIYSKFMGVRIEADQTTVGEGTAATFTLHRHGGRSSNLAKTLQVNVRVTQDGDYISGSAPQTVTFEADQTTATLSLPTADDVVDEADGLITVELLPPTSYTDDQYAYEIGEYRGTPWAVTSVTTAVTDDDYAFPAISILDADALESEGSIEFTVMLDRANDEQEISVDWATSEDGSSDAADGDADFTAASGTLIFAIGETTKTITITLLDDTLGEATETFNVVLSNPTEVVLEDDTGSGTIRDDESDVAVVFAASTLHVEEGNNVVVTFRRLVSADLAGTANCYAGLPNHCFDADADPGNVPLTINLSVTQVGDFLSGSAPTSITFAAGEKFADLSIPTADDNNVEASGTITVQILQGSGYTALATGTIQGQPATNPARVHNVYDNDLTFTIDDAQADESDGQIDFTVRLNAAALEEVTIDAFTQDGDATSHANVTASSFGKDFEAKSETLVFAVGEQQKTFTVDIADDFIYERNETFTVQLSNPPQYLSLADGAAVGTIRDDEEPMIASVSRTYAVVDEGQAGPVRYYVQLTHPVTVASERTPAVVWQTVDGTATEGEDYQAGGGKLSFPLGTTSGFFDVYLVDDKLLEQPLETFTVELIPGSISDDTRFLSISSTDGSFETSIRDNESLTATISSNAESVAEGQQAVFTVKLIGALGAESVSVTFETAGSAVETDDFGTPTGLLSFPPGNTTGNAGTLEIPAGQSSGTITYPILSDSIEEGDETLRLEIFGAYFGLRSASISETQSVATTTILDQDSLTVSIQGTPSVDEGTAATFTIVMSTVSDDSVTVDWETRQVGEDLETGETAVPDADYTAASGSVTIPSGSTSATFTVSTLQDTLAEGDETFKVALTEARVTSSTPVEEFPLGVAMATGSIVDDDTAPDGLTMQATPDSVDEDSGATDLTVTVTLDGTVQFPTDTPVTVEFIDRPNVNRNATLGEDYTATTVRVDIPAGQSSVVTTITLTPDDDDMWEGNEIARLTATSSVLSNSDALGVTILENDVEPNEVVLTVAPATVDEATPTTSLVVTGTLAGGSALPVDTVVTLEAVDDTAVSGDDYEVNMATLTIPAGELSATTTLSLTVLDDNIHEGDEELKVGGTTPGTIQVVPAVVTIQDNDNEPTSIGLSVTAAPIDEGSSAVTIAVEATMLGGGTRNESTQIAMRFVGLTATVGDDFTATWDSSTLTIPAGAFSAVANLTVTPADDTLYEGLEQFAVRGTNSVPGLTVSGVRLSIVDNDPAPTTITLSFDQPSFSEAGEILILEIRATLEGDSTLPIDTSINTSIASLNGKSLLFHGNQTVFPLTIAAGESLATSEIFLLNADDRIDDGDETIELQGIASNPSLEVVSARTVLVEDDSANVALAPATLNIREGNEGKFYSMRLATEPMASVTVIVDLPTNAAFTVSSGSLTFTPDDWNDWQRITVTATEDSNARDEPAATINHTIASDDTKYRAVSVSSVAVTVRDNDSAGATISEATLTIEEGDSGTYTVVLGTEPAGDVTVTVGGVTDTDVTLDKTVLTFTTQNWGTAQTVTVTAAQGPTR